MTGLWLASYVALWILHAAMGVVLVSTLRNFGVLYSSLESSHRHSDRAFSTQKWSQLLNGEQLPNLTLHTDGGGTREIWDFRGTKIGFVVVSATCGGCRGYLEHVLAEGPDPADASVQSFVIVSLSDPTATAGLLDGLRLPPGQVVLYDTDGEVRATWGIGATPYVAVVTEDMQLVRQTIAGTPVLSSKKPATSNGKVPEGTLVAATHR